MFNTGITQDCVDTYHLKALTGRMLIYVLDCQPCLSGLLSRRAAQDKAQTGITESTRD